MAPPKKVRGPSPARRKPMPGQASALADDVQRLTLTMTVQDMERLQKVSDENLRSMSAQALYYIRAGVSKELSERGQNGNDQAA